MGKVIKERQPLNDHPSSLILVIEIHLEGRESVVSGQGQDSEVRLYQVQIWLCQLGGRSWVSWPTSPGVRVCEVSVEWV